MEAEGKVIRTGEGLAIVQIIRKGACGDHCSNCNGCNAERLEIEADCALRVESGDWVLISSKKHPIILGMFVVFILPCILPMIAFLLANGSGLEGYFAAVALAIAFFLIFLLNKSAWYDIQHVRKSLKL
ncbi:MAG: SoxR reducing system RseC family protein [Clostridia bacterium]|nr:SoxR reducing system RseC family protein [Clostridia bacterium]